MRLLWTAALLWLVCSCNKIDKVEQAYDLMVVEEGVSIERVVFVSDSVGFAVGGVRGSAGYLYRTSDAGNSWTRESMFPARKLYDIQFVTSQLGFIASEFNYVHRTVDGGQTWQMLWNMPVAYHEVNRPTARRISFTNDSTIHFVGGDLYEVGSTYRTSDGGDSWTFDTLRHELRGLDFWGESTGIVGGFGYLAYTQDGGLNYTQADFSGDFIIAVEMLSATNAVAVGQDGGIYKSTDAGETWNKVLRKRKYLFTDMLFLDSQQGLIVGDQGLILKTTDGGDSWTELDTGEEVKLNRISYWNGAAYIAREDGQIMKVQF